MRKGARSLVADETQAAAQGKSNQEDESDEKENTAETRRWVGAFWAVVGLSTILISLPLFGLQYEIQFPALVLTGYGLFVLWNPPIAESDAPWTGVMWITIGVVLLLTVQFFTFHWTVEVNGVIIGLFLVFIGILVVLDL